MHLCTRIILVSNFILIMQAPKFAQTSQSFHVELKNRINEYFARTGKQTTGGARLFGKAALRMATTQKRYKMHKFQHLYFWIFYCFLHLYWVMMSDYTKYFSGKIGDIPLKKMTLKDHITFWSFKAVHYALFIVIPIITV